jgi:hypothetical protein
MRSKADSLCSMLTTSFVGHDPERTRSSPRVMEDDSNCMLHAFAEAADAVPQVHPIRSLSSLDRAVMHGERHGIALPQRYEFGPALHPRLLFREDKFTASEILARFEEEDRDLEREREIAVKVLMQAVEVARYILKQQRRRTRLARIVALLQERRVAVRVAAFDAHSCVPVIGNSREMRIKRRAQAADEVGQRVLEVPVLAFAEAVSRHVDVTSEVPFLRVEAGDLPALLRHRRSGNRSGSWTRAEY